MIDRILQTCKPTNSVRKSARNGHLGLKTEKNNYDWSPIMNVDPKNQNPMFLHKFGNWTLSRYDARNFLFRQKIKKNRLTLGRRSRMAQKKDASVQSVPMPYRFVLDDMTLLFGAKQEKMATRWVFKTIIHNMQKYREELIVS